jgi:hypothetical protein
MMAERVSAYLSSDAVRCDPDNLYQPHELMLVLSLSVWTDPT